jgi:hypothetical protein
LKKNETFYTLKTLICRKYNVKKLTPFLQVNNVLVAPPSDTNGFLSIDTYVKSTQLDKPIETKRAYLHIQNYDLQAVFLSKLEQFSQGNNVIHAPAATTDGFYSTDICLSST